MSYFGQVTIPSLDGSLSAFGTIETGELTPLVQLDFMYGINTQTGLSYVSGTGATVDTSSGRLRVQSGTNSAGSAVFISRKTARYRPGQGITARFTGVFANGTASNDQIIGMGSYAGSAALPIDGYFFGYNGTTFSILLQTGSTPSWVAQSSWNQDHCDGTGPSGFNWNPQTGNVMMIKYPYLGYGNIKFYVQNSVTGAWILCHIIEYTNANTAVQVTNPNLTFYAQQFNSGNTSNLTMYVGSVGIFLSGERVFVGNPKWAQSNDKTGITTETSIITLQNCTSYNGVTNRSLIRLLSISYGSTVAHMAQIYMKLGVTLGGTPSYTAINGTITGGSGGATITSGNSITTYDVAGTTVTGGTLLLDLTALGTSNVFDLTSYDLFLAPGEFMTFSASCSNSTEVAIAVNWTEDI